MSANRALSEVVQDILHDLQELIRSEFRLAKAEVAEDARHVATSAVWVGAGAVCAVTAWFFLLWAATYALALVVPMWGAALLVAGATGIAAAVLLVFGRRKVKRLHPTPDRTVASMKENLQWIKQSTK